MHALTDRLARTTDPSITISWIGPGNVLRASRLAASWPGHVGTVGDLWPCLASVDTAGFVAEAEGWVVGLVVYRMQRPFSEVTLENLVVAPQWQRRGVGTRLLEAVKAKLLQGYDCISAVVPETNTAAQLLLRSTGFKATKVLRNHFGDEAGYVMECRGEAEALPASPDSHLGVPFRKLFR